MMNIVRTALLAAALLAALAGCSTDDPDAPEVAAKVIPDLPAAGADAARPAVDPRALPRPRPLLPAMPDLHGGTLVISDSALAGMTAAGVPGAVTQRLLPLKGRPFRNPATFLAAVEDQIGTESLTAHRGAIVTHALTVQETGALPPPLGEADLAEAESLRDRPVGARARVAPPPSALPGSAPPVAGRSASLPAADRLVTGKVTPRAVSRPVPRVAAAAAGPARTVYFDTNRFEVKPQFEGPLEARAKELLRNPQLEVKIEGHADRRGGDELNLILSQRRAQAVRDVLRGKGVPEERMEAQGYGASRPADPANTPDAWAKNRRVEIVPR